MQFFDGTIYLIRIYDRTLSEEEVKENYNYDNYRININDTYYTELNVQDNSYTLSSVSEFEKFRDEVNNGNTFEGMYVELKTDINLQNIENWQPIGSSENPFEGNFNGNGHHILNLNIDNDANHQGLFGNNAGVIQNLYIESGTLKGNYRIGAITGVNRGFIINCTNVAEIKGKNYHVGGICGFNDGGVVERCINLGTVSSDWSSIGGICGRNDSGIIKYCSNRGVIQSTYYGAAGIVGTIRGGKVSSCYNTGNVSTSGYNEKYGSWVAGIVGAADTSKKETITCCYNTGNITSAGCYGAGISGHLGGTMSYCYNTGTIVIKRGNENNNSYAAGIVANIWSGISSGTTVKYCYNTGTVTSESGTNRLGGIVGYNAENSTISNCYTLSTSISTIIGNNQGTSTNNQAKSTSDMKTSSFISLMGGNGYWYLVDNEYPKLIWE